MPTLKERVASCGVGPYATIANKIKKQPIKANKSFVDNNKVSDHHAIIPTEEHVYLTKLSDQEQKIYDLVIKRFLAVLLPAFQFEHIQLTAEIAGETFTASGRNIIDPGFKVVYDHDEEETDEQKISNISENHKWNHPKLTLVEGGDEAARAIDRGYLAASDGEPNEIFTTRRKARE
ncbi:DNA topoisomerase III [Gracilibacillus boraciitolerans JCM 21714]|uniref:DNA topoisomerase III n=1 Tax=Gracilibacillus boraciitolerans JCM 21714 TaxID=1298598 RepID=W4VMX9_9BACI|nr:DNA topoisomerase [Gracilibacillus boraciitolerans]GAE94542.1 DNA topoisomerase III [Gracilibacillus boraciitolerans JCM 21714]